VSAACSSGLFVSVNPATTCTEMHTATAVSVRCDPIPGQFIEVLSLFGMPRDVRVVQSIDGVVVIDQSIAPTYTQSRPNGPGCEPLCEQAAVMLTLP